MITQFISTLLNKNLIWGHDTMLGCFLHSCLDQTFLGQRNTYMSTSICSDFVKPLKCHPVGHPDIYAHVFKINLKHSFLFKCTAYLVIPALIIAYMWYLIVTISPMMPCNIKFFFLIFVREKKTKRKLPSLLRVFLSVSDTD